jgi:hypothetical protein
VCAAQARQPIGQPLDHTGALEGGGDHKQPNDREHRRAAEARQRLIGREQPAQSQRNQHEHGHEVGWKPAADDQRQRGANDQEQLDLARGKGLHMMPY